MNPPLDGRGLAARFETRLRRGRPDGVWQAPGPGQPDRRAHGLQRGLRAAVRHRPDAPGWPSRVRPDSTVRLLSTFGNQGLDDRGRRLAWSPGSARGWTKYPLGVIWALQQRASPVPGLDLLLDSDVPLGAGLSSSHAIECAVITALNELTGRRDRP